MPYQNYVIKTVWQLTLHFETDETIKLQALLKFLQGLHVKYLSYGFSIQKKIELHTIRFWETQFKQLNPKRINNRRYYDNKNIY